MGGKSDLVKGALRAALEALSPEDAMRLAQRHSGAKFEPFTTGYSYKRQAYYDPRYWEKFDDPLLDESGNIITNNEKIRPILDRGTIESLIKPDDELMYRGMSAEELADILHNKRVQSRGDMNFTGGQEGLTYFSSDPLVAESYSNAFAPSQYMPNMEKPAYVISARRPLADKIRNVPGTGRDEIGVIGSVPIEDIVGIHRGNTTAYYPGIEEKGFSSKPSALLNWEGKSLDDILKGRAAGGRTGYAGKGRVVGDVVNQGLELAGKLLGGADEVPMHLQEGYRIGADPAADLSTKQFVDYLNTRGHLPFDPESRAARREDMGYNVDAYHGSPRDIERFKNDYSNTQGYWGGHHYATSSPVDASINYATPEGADVSMRMQEHIDNILDEYHPDDIRNWHEQKYGTAEVNPQDPKLIKEYADDYAKEALGITNEGAVYPVALRMKNPVKIDSPNQTFWGYDVEYNDDGDLVSEGGTAIDLINATRDVLESYDVDQRGYDEVMGKLYEAMIDYGGIDAKTYDDIMRKSNIYAYDASGNMASMGHIMSDVFQQLGHDSIDMPTDVFAGGLGRIGMRGTGGDTRHYILFEPKNIRSKFGAFDPFKAESERLSDADGGRVEADDDVADAMRIAKGNGGGFLRRAVTNLLGPSERKGLLELTRPGSGYVPPKGKPGTVKLPNIGEAEAKPIPGIMEASEGYMKKRGMLGGHELAEYPALDEAFAMRVAEAYDRMRHAPDDPEVRRAYDAMAQETIDQLAAAKDAGIDFTAIRGADPYAASPSLGYADIAERGNLYFFPTDAGFGSSIEFDPSQNPLLKRIGRVGDLDNATVNDAFRIVHDLYGHYGPGNPFFRAPGEERAYLLHRRMYSPEALPAMTSETRGQNSWLNYGPHGSRNRNASSEDTVFADQKTGIMDPFTYLERADGGVVNDAVRIAKDVGGGTTPQVMMEDAKGNKYDAQGNVIPPQNPGPNPARNDNQVAFNLPPENYETEVKPFIEQAVTPMDRPGMTGDPDLVDVMRIATQVAASGQPTDTRGEQNWGRQRAEAVRRAVGADPEGYQSEYRGPFTYNAGDTANYVNTLLDFVAVPEILHDIPYEAGRTGDYGTAAVEGGLNALLTAPGLSALGRAGKAAYNYVRKHPNTVAGLAGLGYAASPDEAEAGPERWFSKLYRAAEAIPMPRMTGEQALAILRKSAPAEELRWTGTDAFLSGQKSVSKDDLLAHLKANQVQTSDVVLGGGDKPFRREDVVPDEDVRAKYRDQMSEAYQAVIRLTQKYNQLRRQEVGYSTLNAVENDLNYAEQTLNFYENKMIDDQIKKIGGLGQAPKYQQYSTPGGENYRETLITYKPDIEKYAQSLIDPAVWSRMTPEQRNQFTSQPIKMFKSGHWDDPNVVGHLRTQMLTATPPGANRPYKLFNVDETQSDWAQAGRKRGFYNQAAKAEWTKQFRQNEEAIKSAQKELDEINKRLTSSLGPEPKTYGAAFNEYHTRRQDLLDNDPDVQAAREKLNGFIRRGQELDASEPRGSSGVAEAPYVTNTQAWTDLSIKKALDQAIDAGADYFTFTPGEVQADRYDLAKHIGKVAWDSGSETLYAYNPQGKRIMAESVANPEDLDEYVGKELADKLRAEEESRRYGIQDAYEVASSDEGGFGVFLNGEQTYEYGGRPVIFGSMGEAKDYINQLIADDLSNNPVTIEGLDLKTGGEGMIDYYNNIYKKRVEKVVKDATGKKVQWEVLPAETAEGIVPRLGFRIDDDVKGATFSTFARGGVVKSNNLVSKALALTSEV